MTISYGTMNRGAERLKALLKHGDQKKLAKRLGVDEGQFSRWLNGKARPPTTVRATLEDEYGIGWRLWDEDCEEDDEPPATERAS